MRTHLKQNNVKFPQKRGKKRRKRQFPDIGITFALSQLNNLSALWVFRTTDNLQ